MSPDIDRKDQPRVPARAVLGLSDSHDAGACLLIDGRIVAAVNEERLNRRKQSPGVPRLSIKAVLEESGIPGGEIDLVALAGRGSLATPPTNNDFSDEHGRHRPTVGFVETLDRVPGARAILCSGLGILAYQTIMPRVPTRRLPAVLEVLRAYGIAAPLHTYDHHDAHLASTYYASGEPDCLIFSNDGFGDGLCAKVAIGRAGRFRVIARNPLFNSLGTYYCIVTHFCGFPKEHHVGKTTGLAAFGDPMRTIDKFRRLFRWDPRRGMYVNDGPIFRDALRLIHQTFRHARREDVAAGMQRHLEDVLEVMARHYLRATGLRRLLLTGGIHANVRANQRIAEIEDLERVYVYPHMGDGGLAAGAAWLAWSDGGLTTDFPRRLDNVYLGPEFPDHRIAGCLTQASVSFTRPENIATAAAQRLAEGRVVARLAGRMEYGPRALGNRSILCAATDPSINRWLNQRLRRTEFMPFAPVVRAEDAGAFFRNVTDTTAHTAEFMTITYNVTDRCSREAPAVVHVDGTARPQILRREVNPDYYDILTAYHRLTGRSVLINTSFNIHEEPIVCSLEDALRAFRQGGLDALIAGPYLVDASDDRIARAGRASATASS